MLLDKYHNIFTSYMKAEKYRIRELSNAIHGKSRMQKSVSVIFCVAFATDLMFLNEFNLKL